LDLDELSEKVFESERKSVHREDLHDIGSVAFPKVCDTFVFDDVSDELGDSLRSVFQGVGLARGGLLDEFDPVQWSHTGLGNTARQTA